MHRAKHGRKWERDKGGNSIDTGGGYFIRLMIPFLFMQDYFPIVLLLESYEGSDGLFGAAEFEFVALS